MEKSILYREGGGIDPSLVTLEPSSRPVCCHQHEDGLCHDSTDGKELRCARVKRHNQREPNYATFYLCNYVCFFLGYIYIYFFLGYIQLLRLFNHFSKFQLLR